MERLLIRTAYHENAGWQTAYLLIPSGPELRYKAGHVKYVIL
ncbi:hypothetical protein ApDm4_1052 [Acetobacter pomorum]|nr:hypothetical protein ApDm4_1052 [Acetobacter pomorum]